MLPNPIRKSATNTSRVKRKNFKPPYNKTISYMIHTVTQLQENLAEAIRKT